MYVPASYTGNSSTPLLLDYHGYTANADIQFTLFPWRKVADDQGTDIKCAHSLHMMMMMRAQSLYNMMIDDEDDG